ncbi:2OG-Fe(II) oxygenase [Nocardia pseudobrasiliensis]|uniref:2-oxoglutarate-Fe(II)-dependent oxygenase superfamily protein n=1 Tax=Nocardia pseudobrasiliensis TaxID=45979 RepID=A0A370HYT3_9NOCA|nr:2OG-Fe(II) oxygenase [Nocardia pseudobrasiliensis]RDI63682.1 2-oxoglutarate-Fe(II)-dependent oxygenase superfamily protein [Nocardia pseudobrasiliensis]
MNEHSRGDRYLVLDDVLSEAALTAFRTAQRLSSPRPSLSTVDRYFDGLAFRGAGPEFAISADPDAEAHLAELAAALRVATARLAVPVGDSPIASTFWAYPAGTKLGWHDDGAQRAGAFTLYLSRQWRASWGGELDIIDCDVDAVPNVHNDLDLDLLASPTDPIAIFPRPNRLVLMRSMTFHRIRRVDAAAGNVARESLTGFVAS